MKYQYFVEHLLIMLAFHGLFNTFLWKKIMFEPTFHNVRALKYCRIELRQYTGTERNTLPENIQCKEMSWLTKSHQTQGEILAPLKWMGVLQLKSMGPEFYPQFLTELAWSGLGFRLFPVFIFKASPSSL